MIYHHAILLPAVSNTFTYKVDKLVPTVARLHHQCDFYRLLCDPGGKHGIHPLTAVYSANTCSQVHHHALSCRLLPPLTLPTALTVGCFSLPYTPHCHRLPLTLVTTNPRQLASATIAPCVGPNLLLLLARLGSVASVHSG